MHEKWWHAYVPSVWNDFSCNLNHLNASMAELLKRALELFLHRRRPSPSNRLREDNRRAVLFPRYLGMKARVRRRRSRRRRRGVSSARCRRRSLYMRIKIPPRRRPVLPAGALRHFPASFRRDPAGCPRQQPGAGNHELLLAAFVVVLIRAFRWFLLRAFRRLLLFPVRRSTACFFSLFQTKNLKFIIHSIINYTSKF